MNHSWFRNGTIGDLLLMQKRYIKINQTGQHTYRSGSASTKKIIIQPLQLTTKALNVSIKKCAYTLSNQLEETVQTRLDSVARYSYQNPTQPEKLKLPISRYGSNKKKSMTVNGTIPTASLRYNHIKQRTTYDRHYNDNSGNVVQQIKDVGRKLGAETLKKYYEKAAPEDKDTIRRILDAYRTGDMPPSKPVHAPTPPPYRPASRTPSRSNQPSTPISDSDNSVPINISNRVSGPNSPAITPTPVRKPGSRVACTPITDYNSGNPTNYSRPPQFQFPMQVPMPNYSPAPGPYSPPEFLH
ncbi:Hypothetical predicted protein [Mytilus galloprovincialis]|uniref:Uncharacterized protein n=1 Tax=Mytilus galloprovincialis TaxID=29158 RepID=A0A8B6DFN5_MYTGA|nr:Hypothetical predicted protein [Mytilus galloprovincialis]